MKTGSKHVLWEIPLRAAWPPGQIAIVEARSRKIVLLGQGTSPLMLGYARKIVRDHNIMVRATLQLQKATRDTENKARERTLRSIDGDF